MVKSRSFVIRGNKLNDNLEQVFDLYGDKYLLDLPKAKNIKTPSNKTISPFFSVDQSYRYQISKKTILEIGIGGGENILANASKQKDIDFLGIDVFRLGIAKTIRDSENMQLSNIKVAMADARYFLDILDDYCLHEIWVFFPDPWPKLKHHKRRLLDVDFFETASRKIKIGGYLRIATDMHNYAQSIIKNSKSVKCLQGGLTEERFSKRVLTNFEKKGLSKGHEIFDFSFKAIDPKTEKL